MGVSELDKAQIILENEDGCVIVVVVGANMLANTLALELEELLVVAAAVFKHVVGADSPIGFSGNSVI